MPYQSYPIGIDLPGIFMAAQQAKAQKLQMEAMQRQQQQQEAAVKQAAADRASLLRARQAAAGGDYSQLQMVAPEESAKLGQMDLENRKFAYQQEQDARQFGAEVNKAQAGPLLINASNGFGLTPSQGLRDPRVQALVRDAMRKQSAGVTVNVGQGGQQQTMPLTSSNQGQQQDEFMAQKQVLADVDNLQKLYEASGGVEKTQTLTHQIGEAAGRIGNKLAPGLMSESTKKDLELGAQKDAALGRLRVSFIVQANKRGMTSETAQEMFDTYVPKEGDAPVTIKAKLAAIRQLARGRMDAAQEALTEGLKFNSPPPATVPDFTKMSPEELQRFISENSNAGQ